MSQSVIFASLSVFLYFIGFIPYIYHVFHGRVVPHPFTWTVWFIFALTNAYILFQVNGWSWSLASLSMRIIALLIGLACGWWFIRKIHLSSFDYISLLLAAGVILFIHLYGLKQAIIAMICVDIIVTLPTLKKIWLDPHTEDSLAWLTTALSQSCLVISLPFLTFENSFFWLYAICANFTIALLIRLRTRYHDKIFKQKVYTFLFSTKEKCVHTYFALKNKL